MKTFELQPIDGRKSFYNKAKVTELDNGDIELTSYTTIVARIHNGKFERLWNGYSATTMRHINAFLYVYGIQGGGKVWWENLETVKTVPELEEPIISTPITEDCESKIIKYAMRKIGTKRVSTLDNMTICIKDRFFNIYVDGNIITVKEI